MLKSATGRAALVLTGVEALTLPQAATAAGPAPTAKPVKDRDTAVIASHLIDQELEWETCEWPGQSQSLKDRLNAIPGTACADVEVPRDWNNPTDGNTINIRISKTDTAGSDRKGMALVNPGGPGGEGVIWGPGMAMMSPELAEHYDFYGFDPRGVGESDGVVCEYEPTEGATTWEDNAARVAGCMEDPLAPFINTEQTAYDMDFIRALMDEDKLSYIGFSYGTWLGSWYQRLFPQHADKFLLDSATDLTRKSLQETWDLQPRSRDRQFQNALLPYMARNDAIFKAGTDPMEIRADWERAGGNRTLLGMLVTAWYILPAMYNTSDYPNAAVMVASIAADGRVVEDDPEATRAALIEFTEKAKAARGADADTTFLDKALENALADVDKKAEVSTAAQNGTGVAFDYTFELIRCQDGQWNKSEGYWNHWLQDLERKAPWIAPFMETPACAHFDAPTQMPKANSLRTATDTLLIQSELDAATPYEAGARSAQVLAGTRLISVDNEGSHGLYPYGTTCVDDVVEDYFIKGTLPKENLACQALPLPLEDETYEVGGTVGNKGKIKIKMRTPEVKEANKIFKEIMAENTATE